MNAAEGPAGSGVTATASQDGHDELPPVRSRTAALGLTAALAVMAAGILVPFLTGWDVHVQSFPPLHARWMPRIGPGSIPAIVLAAGAVVFAPWAARQRWRWLLLLTFGYGLAWMLALATVDGLAGVGHILDTSYEYLNTARAVTDPIAVLHEYVSRIPLHSPDHWPVHIAGHPPGALFFFVALVRLGLGSGLAAGTVVIVIAATTPVAVLVTLHRLGAGTAARRAAPIIALGPAAVWMAVSADAVFGSLAAWGLCCLAFSARSTSRSRSIAWAVVAGLALGYCVMMSYGLPVLGVLALAVLAAARSWRPLPWAAGSALAVVLAFAAGGFVWWQAYPVLVRRYYDGVQKYRPYSFWIWGNLSALGFSAGPVVGSAVAAAFARGRSVVNRIPSQTRVVVLLALAALACVLVADISGMSKAEVERIWLPFEPWMLAGTALLSARWRRWGLAVQLTMALLVQHLLFTGW
ncbi:hypothetical protein [Humibacter sp. RRB41]|uniref:hypothetical protein n=1 Tax=Humibacter sp. RRB41 TaxID=2919946 RepID=UPI001FAAAB3D|nr:hypothetical protein [Humibacter sp. RRB41]